MSSVTYSEDWRLVMADIVKLLEKEVPAVTEDGKAIKAAVKDQAANKTVTLVSDTKPLGIGLKGHPKDVLRHQAVLYIKYLSNFRKLEECYDQIVHPQKLIEVRKLLSAVAGRMLELRQWLVEYTCNDSPILDGFLLDMRMNSNDLEIRVPRYFLWERRAVLQQREALLDALLAQRDAQKATTTETSQDPSSMAKDAAVLIIQRAERARLGRHRAAQMQAIRASEKKDNNEQTDVIDVVAAGDLITRVARGHLIRNEVARMRQDELRLIGMLPNMSLVEAHRETTKRVADEKERKKRQADFAHEYEESLKSLKQRIYEQEGPRMKEQMQDEIRQWFLSHYRQTGKFPDYPSHLEGGSAKIFLEPPPVEVVEVAKSAKKKPAFQPPKRRGEDSDEDKITIPASSYIKAIQESSSGYYREWYGKNEADNFEQRFDAAIIKAATRPQVANEIRTQVDELMRIEVENLKLAIDADKKKKKKAKKKAAARPGSQPTSKPNAKPPPATKRHPKKGADITAHIPVEQLYAELVHHGIVKKVPSQLVKDYVGDNEFLVETMEEAKIEMDPSPGSVRRAIVEYCCLPLGSAEIHESGPAFKAVLLCGSAGSGKTMLANAIATETGSNVFDLTPSNTYGKYPGKSVKMLLHMVFKVAKIMAPSIILVDEAEQVFLAKKKTKKNQRGPDGPKRIKKELVKQTKLLKPEHRVMIIGCSARPFDAESKAFMKFFGKVVYLPRLNYGDRRLLCNAILEKMELDTPHFSRFSIDTSLLAYTTEGYTAGAILKAIKIVMTERRFKRLPVQPLSLDEFIGVLATMDPVFAEEDELFKSWRAKLPLAKARKKKEEEEKAAEDEKKRKQEQNRRTRK